MFELGVFPPQVGNWGHQLNGCSVSRGELDAALAGQRQLHGAEFADDGATMAALRQRLAILFPAARAPAAAVGTVHWRASRTRLFALAAAPFERGFLLRPATLAAAEWSALLARAAEDGALRRRQLPWWLQGTAAASDCAVGLLTPHELRALAGDLADLVAAARTAGHWPLDTTDTTELQDFVAAAAAEGCWLAGIEPGT